MSFIEVKGLVKKYKTGDINRNEKTIYFRIGDGRSSG